MKIAILGSGNVGLALAKGLIKSGNEVVFGVRNPESPKTLKALESIPGSIILSLQEAAKFAEVILLTTPPEAVLEIIPALGDCSTKTLVDTTNSIRTRPEPYPTAYHALKSLCKTDKVVKCFNSTGFENMENPAYPQESLDMFAAGDNKESKRLVEQLAKEIGFANCYDFGGDDKVELLEKFALSWINLAIMQGHGRGIGFKIIKRN